MGFSFPVFIPCLLSSSYLSAEEKTKLSRWLMPVILAIWEAESRRTVS
jgi:hypothetical protein